ncbi:putative apolipoprotein N-acyltransferase [Actinacidiphila reveromycinica]|uniref:Apolipoprotein N-acyltransferase n=1 Tax=Actinacidiphila reveromycinica TaxID=659352 RepID=A0A7U3UZR2_9ACTN|nr:apolipoprotein N-acyltransferase [Streptomyces sp. SN-593]BBB01832.1 putative apolipoprotein N-acyltransferase [Streptomyces sp. SN-593]
MTPTARPTPLPGEPRPARGRTRRPAPGHAENPPPGLTRRSAPGRARRTLGAVAAGALPALAFPAPSLWWLAYVALVPWLLLVRSAPTGRRAALDGWFGGAGFMLAVHHWLLPSLTVFLPVLALLLGGLWAPWGWLVRRLLGAGTGRPAVGTALVLLPSGWLLIELVRSWQYLGGPWGLLGASQWQVAPALRLASIGGVWLVSALVVLVNTAVAALCALPSARRAAAAALLASAVATGAVWLWAPRPQRAAPVRIAVVQPGPVAGPAARFAREVRLTRRLAGSRPDLVVWGESSVGVDLSDHPGTTATLAALSRLVGADLLVDVDAERADGTGISKTSALVGPHGVTGPTYDKMRLVPFGEYVPMRPLLGWATSVGKAAGEDRRRGSRQVVMDTGTLRFGPLVCFESAFPDMSRHLAADGARLLVAQSSTASFQGSWAPAQHASLAALRSAESWRPMVHATLTGISAVYGPDGTRVGHRVGTGGSTAAVYDVPTATDTSPYVRFGDWVPRLALLLVLAAAVRETVRTVRRGAAAAARAEATGPGRAAGVPGTEAPGGTEPARPADQGGDHPPATSDDLSEGAAPPAGSPAPAGLSAPPLNRSPDPAPDSR